MFKHLIDRLNSAADGAFEASVRYFIVSTIISMLLFFTVFLFLERSLIIFFVFVPAMTFGVSVCFFIAHFLSHALFGYSVIGVGVLLFSFAYRVIIDISEAIQDFEKYSIDSISIYGDVGTLGLLVAGLIVVLQERLKQW